MAIVGSIGNPRAEPPEPAPSLADPSAVRCRSVGERRCQLHAESPPPRWQLVAALLLARAQQAPPDPRARASSSSCKRGGLVLVLRHAATDQSKQDEDPGRPRRLLHAAEPLGRGACAGARDRRAASSGSSSAIGTVLTSRFCRTRETARLAFGRGTVEPALLNTITAAHDAAWRRQIRAARRLLGTRPAAGTLTVLVTHGVLVSDATGLTLEEGETLVFRPLGNSRFRLVGRIAPGDWPAIRAPSSVAGAAGEGVRGPRGLAPARRRAGAATGRSGTRRRRAGKLGRLDPATGKVTEVPLGDGSAPHGVIVGPDGAAVGHRRRPQRDRAGRPGDARGEALPAPGLERLREPQHGHVRPARPPLVHRPERHLRPPRPAQRRAARLPRARAAAGPYGIATTPRGDVWYASLAGSHIARIDLDTGKATVAPAADAGPGRAAGLVRLARAALGERVERRAGRALRPATGRWREWRLPGAAAALRRLRRRPRHRLADRLRRRARSCASTRRRSASRASALRASANVRQLLGRPGEVWGAESGADRIVSVSG